MLPDNWQDESAKLQDKKDKDKQPPVDETLDDDDIPPRQIGFWD
jgi:hypothetical protein